MPHEAAVPGHAIDLHHPSDPQPQNDIARGRTVGAGDVVGGSIPAITIV
jgi:hypothetical protein